ncbi:sugar transferase [Pseudolysinimonas sp.]|uniref:sugar transferase n=1 Tax=Pseudolysinimonas sp. TaxID=2680009 RepID=UPI00378469BD
MDLIELDRAPGTSWAAAYATRLLMTDLVLVVWSVIGAQLARFGASSGFFATDAFVLGDLGLSYSTTSVALVLLWVGMLTLTGTRDSRVIGVGPTEYRRVIRASLLLFGLVAIAALIFRLDLARSYILVAFPVGVVSLLFGRWTWRKWLVRRREAGEYTSRAVLVGSRDGVDEIARDLKRQPSAGYRVVAACIPGDTDGGTTPFGVTVHGSLEDIPALLARYDADTVIVTSSHDLPPRRIRELSWSLEPGRQHLVVAPSLTDIGGPRIHIRPAAGLPLVHIETPRYEGFRSTAKRAFDFAAAATGIVLLAPLLAVIAVAIKIGSPGPVLFRQPRIGRRGEPFGMLKFRSMVVDAEARLAEVAERGRRESNDVMFKMRDDPRVTSVGRVLRRYSLDELPQLFNVLIGTMSLVGPRPPLEREVAVYENHVYRRFLVKPGITGLWQVSGRANLSWEETVRLDLYYVENWSLVGDLVILWRTARAVLGRDGAY